MENSWVSELDKRFPQAQLLGHLPPHCDRGMHMPTAARHKTSALDDVERSEALEPISMEVFAEENLQQIGGWRQLRQESEIII